MQTQIPSMALLDQYQLTGYPWIVWKTSNYFFFSWKKNISVMLSWFIWGIKGNFEFKYKWEHGKKSPLSLKCLSIFTFLFLGMNNPQAFMSPPVSYFCPDVTHSLFLHHFFPPALFQRDKWQLSLSLLRSQPFPQELGCHSSLVLKILSSKGFDTFYFCAQRTFSIISLNCSSVFFIPVCLSWAFLWCWTQFLTAPAHCSWWRGHRIFFISVQKDLGRLFLG